MRTTIRMSTVLAREAKKYAAAHGQSFTQVVETAVSELLARKKRAPSSRKRIILPTFGNPNRKLTWEQINAAADEAQFEDDMASLGLKRSP
jgi:hypothetical protein